MYNILIYKQKMSVSKTAVTKELIVRVDMISIVIRLTDCHTIGKKFVRWWACS